MLPWINTVQPLIMEFGISRMTQILQPQNSASESFGRAEVQPTKKPMNGASEANHLPSLRLASQA